jgi:hypothetical protein
MSATCMANVMLLEHKRQEEFEDNKGVNQNP